MTPQLVTSVITSILASMTSILANLFTSANALIASRVESLRQAETDLIALAKQRFSPADLEHEIEVFDTDIPRAALRLSKTDVKCQINTVDEQDAHFVVHGVKVTKPSTTRDTAIASPLVILHGYMNGSLYFYRNLLGLARHFEAVSRSINLGGGYPVGQTSIVLYQPTVNREMMILAPFKPRRISLSRAWKRGERPIQSKG